MFDPRPFIALGTTLYKGAKMVGVPAREKRELGRLIDETLRIAICGENPDEESVKHAAKTIRKLLRKTPIPAEPPTHGVPDAVATKIRGRFPQPSGDATWDERIEWWIRSVMSQRPAVDALVGVSCDGGALPAEVLEETFSSRLILQLEQGRTNEYRSKLLDALAEAEATRTQRAALVVRARRRVAAAGSAAVATGAATYGAVDAATHLSTPKIAAIAAAAGIVVAAGGAVTGGKLSRASSHQLAARQAARFWLANLLAVLYGQEPTDTTPEELYGALNRSLRGESDSAAHPNDGAQGGADDARLGRLLEDLGWVRERAEESGDEQLSAALIEVEGGLRSLGQGVLGFDRSLRRVLMRAIDSTDPHRPA